jgi:Bacterial Ig domain
MRVKSVLSRRVLPLALGILLIGAGTAAAAPDRSATLSASSTSFMWTGQIGVGATALTTFHDTYPCNMPGHTCDYTLLHVTTPGKVTVKTSAGSSPTTLDIDLWVYLSDASGTKGKQKVMSAATGANPNEQASFTADEPGYYLVEGEYDIVVGGTYAGEAKLEPGVGIEANTPPTVAIKSPKKKVKSTSFKSISGMATDDSSVTKVEIAVLKGKGSSCQSMTASGKFAKAKCTAPKFLAAKGTTKWSYKLKTKLKKGTYLVLVKASDDGGASSTTRSVVKVT